MNYMGGMKEGYQHLAEQTFKFLKKCLRMVEPSMPFRGPKYYKEEIYRRIYHGGIIK